MKRSILLIITALVLGFGINSCKKDGFVADTAMREIDDSLFYSYKTNNGNPRTPRSMAYDPTRNALYFYLVGPTGTGFDIVGYNLASASNASVYTNSTWLNGNGSEGKNLYVRGNDLWIPGGANNNKAQRLDIGNFTMSLAKDFNFDNVMFGTEEGDSPYDMVELGGFLYIVSMRDFVFYGDYSELTGSKGSFAVSDPSHGSGIESVASDGNIYLAVKCGSAGKIELRIPDGTLVRSVPLSATNYSPMLKDSKSRLYVADDNNEKIIRYSPDLLTKEEFPAKDIYSFNGLALKEESDHITIYGGYGNGIGMIRIPN